MSIAASPSACQGLYSAVGGYLSYGIIAGICYIDIAGAVNCKGYRFTEVAFPALSVSICRKTIACYSNNITFRYNFSYRVAAPVCNIHIAVFIHSNTGWVSKHGCLPVAILIASYAVSCNCCYDTISFHLPYPEIICIRNIDTAVCSHCNIIRPIQMGIPPLAVCKRRTAAPYKSYNLALCANFPYKVI